MPNYLCFDDSVSMSEQEMNRIAQTIIETIKKELPEEAQRYDVVKTILNIAKERLKTTRLY